MSKEIKIEIDKEGKVSFEAFGYKGNGCEEAIKALSKGLGKQTGKHLKNEYNDI